MPSTFEQLIDDLTRDFQRAQPTDALQFGANWFQKRLEEQRTRIRSAFATSSLGSVPQDLYEDTALGTSSSALNPPFSGGFGSAKTSPRPSIIDPPTLKNPFGPQSALTAFSPANPRGNLPTQNSGPFVTINEDEALSPTAFASPFTNPFALTAPPHPSSLALDPHSSLGPPPSALGRRTSVSAESIIPNSNSTTPLPNHPKSPQQVDRIKKAIKNNFIFRDVEDKQLHTVLAAMEEVHAEPNECVITQGDQGDWFYVVEEGLLLCYVKDESTTPTPPASIFSNPSPFGDPFSPPPSAHENPDDLIKSTFHPRYGKRVADCGPGSSFGELALMYGHPRAATVLAVKPSTLWRLDRMTFRTIILKAAHGRRTMYETFLAGVSLLSGLSAEERSKIADALVSVTVEDDQVVIREGEMGDTFFFVEEGEAIVTKRRGPGEEGDETLNVLKKGAYFGELSLLRLEPRAATVRAKKREDPSEPKLKVAQMKAAAFTRLLGPMRDIMERNAGEAYGVTSPTKGFSS